MRHRVLPVLAALCLGACSRTASPKPAEGVAWRDGAQHEAALAEAASLGKPVMLYFTQDG